MIGVAAGLVHRPPRNELSSRMHRTSLTPAFSPPPVPRQAPFLASRFSLLGLLHLHLIIQYPRPVQLLHPHPDPRPLPDLHPRKLIPLQRRPPRPKVRHQPL